jgi:hypothetical protein
MDSEIFDLKVITNFSTDFSNYKKRNFFNLSIFFNFWMNASFFTLQEPRVQFLFSTKPQLKPRFGL